MLKSTLLCTLALAIGVSPAMASVPAHAASTLTPTQRKALQLQLHQLRQKMQNLSNRMTTMSAKLGTTNTSDGTHTYTTYATLAHSGTMGSAGLTATDGAHTYITYSTLASSDMMGIVGLTAADGKSLKVIAVTPGGPADQATIKVGDIITQVNGKPAAETNNHIKAGTHLTLQLTRAGKPLTVKLTATQPNLGLPTAALARLNAAMATQQGVKEALQTATGQLEQSMHSTDPGFKFKSQAAARAAAKTLASMFSPWWGLHLARLNANLASYFGTDHGALVLATQPKIYPGLEAGDVITAVNGHAVRDPSDAMRALRGTTAGKTVQLIVLRHRHTHTITLKAPTATTDLSNSHTSATRSYAYTVMVKKP